MTELELADAILRHSLDLQRLSAHEEARALDTLRQLEQELRQLLAAQDLTEAGRREINALIDRADKVIAAHYDGVATQLDTRQLVLVVANNTADALKLALPAASLPTPERLTSLSKDVLVDGAPSSAWWAKQSEDLQFKFAAQVRQGIVNGESQQQIVQRIVGKGGEPGLLDVARRNATTLVHSSVMSAANDARLAVYRKNAANMRGVRWLATLDGHTCPRCIALDGLAWDLDGNPIDGNKVKFQSAPLHWSCRCVLSPIAKGIDEIFGSNVDNLLAPSLRASASGPTNAVDFGAFLKRQSASFVDEVLGKKRAQLWRSGQITLRDLVSGTGRELSLAELQAK